MRKGSVSGMPKVGHGVVLFHTKNPTLFLLLVSFENTANKLLSPLCPRAAEPQVCIRKHQDERVYIKLCLKPFQVLNAKMSSQMREFPEKSDCPYID